MNLSRQAATWPGRHPAVHGITINPLHYPSPTSRVNPSHQCRNVRLLSIDYAFRPRLRCRLTPGGRTWPGKPWDSGDWDSHPVFRYSCPHNHEYEVHRPFRARLQPVVLRSPTVPRRGPANSARCLLPIIFGAGPLEWSAVTHCLNDGCL